MVEHLGDAAGPLVVGHVETRATGEELSQAPEANGTRWMGAASCGRRRAFRGLPRLRLAQIALP